MKPVTWLQILIPAVALLLACSANAQKGAPIPPEPEFQKATEAFRSALADSQWELAVEMCTPRILQNARYYTYANRNSFEQYLREMIPVDAITSVTEFPISGHSSDWSGRKLTFSSFVDAQDPASTVTVRWTFDMYHVGERWMIDFDDIPFRDWAHREITRLENNARRYEEEERQIQNDLKGVTLKITSDKPRYTVGEPVLVRIELVNGGGANITYDSQQIAVNGSMKITKDTGEEVPYTGGSYQTGGSPKVAVPGSTALLEPSYDITKHYDLSKPGRYSLQHRGHGLVSFTTDVPSNSVPIEIVPRP